MNEQQYNAILNLIRSQQKREHLFTILCRYSPLIDIVIYISLFFYLAISHSNKLYAYLIIPAICLVLVSVFRKYVNKPRPSDVYNIIPLISHTKGESFPSRHTASAFIISYACFYISITLGIITFLVAIYVGVSRIVAGVHFIKDVLAAFVLSSLLGLLFLLV